MDLPQPDCPHNATVVPDQSLTFLQVISCPFFHMFQKLKILSSKTTNKGRKKRQNKKEKDKRVHSKVKRNKTKQYTQK